MSYLKPNSGGVYEIPSINISNTLYIKGQSINDFIAAAQVEHALTDAEVVELKAIVSRIDISELTGNWIVNDTNRNAVLKGLIDGLTTSVGTLNTKTNLLDTTALTQSWAVTDTNKNATLKTRIDGNDTSLGLLNTKTQYITSVQGNNSTNPKTKSTCLIEVYDRDENRILLNTGALNFLSINSFSDSTQNTAILCNAGGVAQVVGKNVKISPFNSSDNIDIGLFGISNTGQINIGGSLSKINIGSLETPIVGTSIGDMGYNDNTIITIGKRTTLKNTLTYLNGNINTGDSRLISLSVTDVVTWETLASWFAGFTLSNAPYWLAYFAISGTPNYRYSDVIKMANNYLTNGLTKNNSIETSNDLGLKKLTVIDTSVVGLSTAFDALLQRLVFQAFAVHGSHSIGSIWGQTDIYAGSGAVVMRCDGGAIDWAFKNAGNSNYVKVSNLDTEVVQCNGSGGNGTLKLGAFNGNIDMYVGTAGTQASGTKVIQVKSTKQVVIGDNNTQANRYDATTKLIIDQTNLNDGLKVCKASGSTTRVNHDSVNTGGIILQDSYSGTTNKALYTIENGAKLMYYGDQVYPPVTQLQAGTAGITYLIDNPTNLTNSATIPSITMSGTYTPATGTTITRSGYTVGLSYQLATIKSDYIPSGNNPILDGVYEANLWANYQGNNPAKLHSKLFLTCETTSFGATSLITKGYSGSGTGAVQAIKTLQLPVAQVLTGLIIQTTGYVKFDIGIIVFPAIQVVSSGSVTLTCTLIDNTGYVHYYFPTLSASAGTADRTFSAMNGANPTIVEVSDLQFFQFQVAITSGTGTISQASARGVADANYQITLKVKMMLYDGISNQTSLNYNSTELYALTLPLKSVDITQYTIFSKIEYEPYFIQVSGSASNHSITLLFRDGNLSHLHSTINPVSSAVSTPNLTAVLNVGSSAGFNNISDISTLTASTINATTIAPTNITNWNVKSIVAGSNITVSNASGEVTINSTASVVSPQVYSGAPVSIGSIAGFSNNQYYFGTSVYDFDNYNYDIEFVINQGSGAGILLYFCWNNDVDFNNYQLVYDLIIATNNEVGVDSHSALFYTQNSNGFQASYKGTLRALPAPSASNYNRLMLEGSLTFNFQPTGTRGFTSPARWHRSTLTYAGATQNSIAQFNGARSLSLFTGGHNYASNNPCHMRITRVMKNLPGS